MKKKWMIRTGLLLVLVTALVFVSMINTRVERQIMVHTAMYDVSVLLNDIQNYPDWYPGIDKGTTGPAEQSASASRSLFIISPHHQLILQVINPVSVLVTETKGRKETINSIVVSPGPDANNTQVNWSSELPVYLRVINYFLRRDNMQEALINLKARLEDPTRKYGFEIGLVPVTDTIILTAKQIASDTTRVSTLQQLYNTVHTYISNYKPAGAKDYYYVTESPLDGHRIEFAVGVPVTSPSLPDSSIEFLRLPASGHVLTGHATIAKLAELYVAMNKYANDKDLQKVAQHLEKYTVEPALVAVNPGKKVELIFPVF